MSDICRFRGPWRDGAHARDDANEIVVRFGRARGIGGESRDERCITCVCRVESRVVREERMKKFLLRGVGSWVIRDESR